MKNWNPEYISSNIKKPLVNIYQHTKPIFGPYWDSSKPMGSIRTIKRRNAHQESTMTMKELVSRMKSESSEDYVYYSANINAIEEILLDIYPWELLELDPNSEKQNMNFWIGKKGTIADTHYDGYYNFYVQVYYFLSSYFSFLHYEILGVWKKEMECFLSRSKSISLPVFAPKSCTISNCHYRRKYK